MRLFVLAAYTLIVTGCSSADQDQNPFFAETVGTDRRQEAGIQRVLQQVAQLRGLSFTQAHYVQDFGCSNIYALRGEGGEIVVINPFGFEYRVLAYASNKEVEARLTPVARELATKISSAQRFEAELC